MKLTYSAYALMRADKKKADGTCPIYYFVRVGAFTAKIPSGKTINAKDWDAKNRCPKRTNKNLMLLATFLNQKISGFETYMLTQQTLGKKVTSTMAATYFKESTDVSLFKFYEDQIRLWEHKYSPNTIKSYESTLRILKEFNPKLDFGDLSPLMIDQFDKYMSDVRHNALNGRFVKHKNLKSIINQAIRKGVMKENPYRTFKIRSSAVNRRFLTIAEVKTLMSLEIPEETPILFKVRNIFVFCCFTGLRFCDVMSLKVGQIKLDRDQARLEFTVTKTNRALMVPLSPEALRIVEIYTPITTKNQNKPVFPKIANPTINRELKDLMVLAGIDKWISFHCSRHTFASNLVEAGTSTIYIKELLGHKKLEQTQIYAKANKNDLFEPMSKLNNLYR